MAHRVEHVSSGADRASVARHRHGALRQRAGVGVRLCARAGCRGESDCHGGHGCREDAPGQGNLLIATTLGEVRQARPVVYQQVGKERLEIASQYVLEGKRVSFAVGEYDRKLPLVIDPVLVYSTFLGGSSYEDVRSIAVGSPGWNIAGVADYNADAKVDILWRNQSSGIDAIWLMNGTSYSTRVLLPTVGLSWQMQGPR